jgi:hypothetical protein
MRLNQDGLERKAILAFLVAVSAVLLRLIDGLVTQWIGAK